MKMNILGNWVDSLQAAGRYTFLRQEAVESTGLTGEAVTKSVQRLVRRKRLAKVKDYFYVIVPTEYRSTGAPPVSWFIHPLMEAMHLPYYVGLLSAAALHGASHQQPQEFQVMTDRSVRTLKIARQRIHFIVKRHLELTPLASIKTPTGSIRVSTREATVADLVRFNKSAGRLSNVATVIGEMAQSLNPELLEKASEAGNALPVIQRLGYILDLVAADKLAAPLADWIAARHPRPTLLVPGRPMKHPPRNSRWSILENDRIEVDA
jgi:predicted transcriptional regulator of viral defense system